MSQSHTQSGVEQDSPPRRWPAAMLKTLRVVGWGWFVYSTPGMLLLVLMVAGWLVPGIAVLLALAALQVPIYFALSRLMHRGSDDELPPAVGAFKPALDPRFTAAYWSGRKSADFGSSRRQ